MTPLAASGERRQAQSAMRSTRISWCFLWLRRGAGNFVLIQYRKVLATASMASVHCQALITIVQRDDAQQLRHVAGERAHVVVVAGDLDIDRQFRVRSPPSFRMPPA
jgi:hypothetical protein